MIAVIGCGNSNRCDDGAGPEVMRALIQRRADCDSPSVQLLDAGTDGMAVMFAARGCRSLIVVGLPLWLGARRDLQGARCRAEPSLALAQPARFPLGPCAPCRTINLSRRLPLASSCC
jgi:hypothetical protein